MEILWIPLCGSSVCMYYLNLQNGLEFLTNFDTSAHAQLTIILLYILFPNTLTWYQLKTYIEDTPSKMGPQDDVKRWSRDFSWKFL